MHRHLSRRIVPLFLTFAAFGPAVSAQPPASRAVDAPTLRMLLAGLKGSARRGADGGQSPRPRLG
jgi:hypothetical protein